MYRAMVATAVAVGCWAGAPAPAEAGLSLGLEVGPNFVLTDTDPFSVIQNGLGDDAGIGISARGGYSFEAGLFTITPEAKLGFESPGGPDAFRILGGLRLALAKGVAPVVFAHAGGTFGDLEAFTWDVGGGLDLNFIPVLHPGVFVSYNRAESSPGVLEAARGFDFDEPGSWEWLQIGISVTLNF
ncbi:MAG TPA: hypothetical protein RMG48_10365 [Myxococcales bacterium LLY-WYZ-16_1]|nr:hypothetical protein [Myxococcales bacterium LLY-WYZ-16_1]